MKQTDCNSLHTFIAEVIQNGWQAGQIQRRSFIALISHAAGYLSAQMARYKRRRFNVVQVKKVRPVTTRYFEYIAETFGGN